MCFEHKTIYHSCIGWWSNRLSLQQCVCILPRKALRVMCFLMNLHFWTISASLASRQESDLMRNQDNYFYLYVFVNPVSMETVLLMHVWGTDVGFGVLHHKAWRIFVCLNPRMSYDQHMRTFFLRNKRKRQRRRRRKR